MDVRSPLNGNEYGCSENKTRDKLQNNRGRQDGQTNAGVYRNLITPLRVTIGPAGLTPRPGAAYHRLALRLRQPYERERRSVRENF